MKKGEIWLVDLPSTNGHEQTGARPVLVVAETEANIAIIIPFTSQVQSLKFPHTLEIRSSKKNGLKELSVALIFQIRAIDRKRLKRKIGELEDAKLNEVDGMLRNLLNL